MTMFPGFLMFEVLFVNSLWTLSVYDSTPLPFFRLRGGKRLSDLREKVREHGQTSARHQTCNPIDLLPKP
jgi:hypothetical protein